MRVDEFQYELPEERIAQRPLAERGASRLLVLDRRTGARTHSTFARIATHLPPKPVIVLNDTSVIPARLVGTREGTGGRAEVFLLNRIGAEMDPMAVDAGPWGRWQALVSASKKIRAGAVIVFGEDARATVVEPVLNDTTGGTWIVELEGRGALAEGLAKIGAAPLPPYIRRGADSDDLSRYQTVFAKRPGAVAAPTAGLHFTPESLAALESAGATIAHVTLHVGAGTFLPVRVDDTSEHHMHRESFDIPAATAETIRLARISSRPVLAVGTTSLRALESAARDGGRVSPGPGATDLFITPGFRFHVVDHLLTNFHAPKSTLLMLVSAFAGLDAIRDAYADALAEGYRFLSYGDAMLIL